MDSYPPEFIFHHVPLMAVIGLGTARDLVEQPTSTTGSVQTPPSSKSQSRRSSLSAASIPISTKQQLSRTLLSLLTAKSQVGIWGPGKNASAVFHVVAVDKNHQFPPRKPTMRPPAQTHHLNMPIAHSAISPLTSGSPVHPDGLIPPIWVRKHREILPSVVVGFYDLWHHTSPDPIQEKEEISSTQEGTPESMDKEKDYILAMEINERRKSLLERGIKFSAVILLKTQNIDKTMDERMFLKDQAMDERLAYIRKVSGLDGRHAFFVLPSSQYGDFQDFVSNLQKSLYEYGLNYYREHGKRVKRKRSRLPSPSGNFMRPPLSEKPSTSPQPLGIQGWMIRYDYKLATFAEFRQDMEAAIRYYESAYNLIIDLFAPQSSITPGATGLPIRSKRWVEARILADTISLKLCKLNLYVDSPSAALAQLNKHVSTFKDISNTRGIGEDTFEYWAWLSKQYRIFADILEIAIRTGFTIPDPAKISHNTTSSDFRFSMSSMSSISSMTSNPNTGSGINPTMVLQHPGFYYFMAAKYNSLRRKHFLNLEKYMKKEGVDNSILPPQDILDAEQSIDHSTLTIELYTKSYEQFKAQKTGRMTLYLASEIANTYLDAGKYDTALKFFERIAKTYRKEHWHTILESILKWSLVCAKDLGNWEKVVEYLIELLSDQFSISNQQRIEIHNELTDILFKMKIATLPELRQIMIDMDEINSFLTCRVQFKDDTTFIGAETLFQIAFSTQAESPPIPLRFTFLRLSYNDSYFNHYLRDNKIEKDNTKLEWIDCKNCLQEDVEGEGLVWVKDVDLNFSKGITKVFEGSIEPKESGDLQLQAVSLGFLTEQWEVELHFNLKNAREEHSKRKWLIGNIDSKDEVTKPTYTVLNGTGERTSIKVTQKLARLDIQAKHSAPALLDEYYPIELTVVNLEHEEVKTFLNAEIVTDAPSNPVDSEDFITLDPTITANMTNNLKDIDIGIIPAGESVVKIVYVLGKKSNLPRTLHLTVYYSSTSSVPSTPYPARGWIEKKEDFRIHFIVPFSFSFDTSQQSESIFERKSENSMERVEKYFLVAKITTTSPCEILVSDIDLNLLGQANAQTRMEITASSIEIDNDFQGQVWKQGNVYNVNYLLELTLMDIKKLDIDIGLLVIQWKRNQQSSVVKDTKIPCTESTVVVPQLIRKKAEISAYIRIPPNPIVGQLFTLVYKIINWTSSEKKIHVNIEVNDSFVFSGYKQTHFIVPGMGEHCFKVNCFPLIGGKMKLPKVNMERRGEFEGDEENIQIIAPGYKEVDEDDYFVIFVKPKIEI